MGNFLSKLISSCKVYERKSNKSNKRGEQRGEQR